MRQTIVIIGALPDDPSRTELLAKLNTEAPSVNWEWIQAKSSTCRPPDKYLRPVVALISRNQVTNTIIVKLPMLHGATQHLLHRHSGCRLVNAPETHQTLDLLVQWIVHPDSNLIPPREWLVSVPEAAFLAIMSKLIRNCRWANDCSGHSFLKKNDLINQSPVLRSGYESVRISAVEQLNLLITDGILLKKGAEASMPWMVLSPPKRSSNAAKVVIIRWPGARSARTGSSMACR